MATEKIRRLNELHERATKLKGVLIPYHHVIPDHGGVTVSMTLDTLEILIEALEAKQQQEPPA